MNDRFVIDDVEMRRSATWPGGPHVLSAELPDGRILGHVIPQEGEWLWRLADETEWHAPRPVEGNVAWTGNGVLDRFLEDESLFGEFLRTPVSEGGVEPLVVEPPHVVVEVGA